MKIDKTIFADMAWLPNGWAKNIRIAIDEAGNIAAIDADQTPKADDVHAKGHLMPGMINLHSHAHQRAMAGMSEFRASEAGGEDSFWTWRVAMHAFAKVLTPEMLETIATQLYVEMVKAGFTSVCEFHYMHHDADGTAYAEPAEMSLALVRAAQTAGIGLSMLPVLYSQGGYLGKEPNEGQRRFICSPEQLLSIISRLQTDAADDPMMAVGVAPHSPRQASEDAMREVIGTLLKVDPGAPIHIHVAEQEKDVTESVEVTGQRPVEWTMNHFDVGPNWCLIHATHLTDQETDDLAASGAVAGLCPATEANLGDGIFPLGRYLDAGGVFGIGSDSHVSVSMVEELRWLEYGQRLIRRRRNVSAAGPGGSTATRLYAGALAGGAQVTGRSVGAIAVGKRADFIILDPDNPTLVGKTGERLFDSAIFAGNANIIRDVWVGGVQRVDNAQHVAESLAFEDFAGVMRSVVTQL
jgi:formimidoylglutamate deiminase